MSRSLRRALAVQFAATMAIGLPVTSLHGGSILAVNVPSGGVRLECALVGASQARHAA